MVLRVGRFCLLLAPVPDTMRLALAVLAVAASWLAADAQEGKITVTSPDRYIDVSWRFCPQPRRERTLLNQLCPSCFIDKCCDIDPHGSASCDFHDRSCAPKKGGVSIATRDLDPIPSCFRSVRGSITPARCADYTYLCDMM